MTKETIKKIYRRIYSLGGTWGDFRDAYLSPLRKGTPDRVLDAGCGQGHLKGEFERFGQKIDYFGIDLTVGDTRWTFRVNAVADLQALPFREHSFDKIISIEVLEHVEYPDLVFAESSRVLRPGGSFFIAVPFVWHLHQEPHDHHRFTKFSIQSMASRHGLDVESLMPMGGYFSVLRYMFSNYSFIGSHTGNGWQWLARSVNQPFKWLDSILVAPLCYALDFLDTEKKLTLGYHVHLKKRGNLPEQDTRNPYTCPQCRMNPNASLKMDSNIWTCSECLAQYPVQSGVPRLLIQELKVATGNVKTTS